MKDSVHFLAEDEVTIVGAYRAAADARGAVLLLHMMPAAKESWSAFAGHLSDRGLASLAIDLRGHGESTRRGETLLDYRAFTDEEHLSKRLDVEASLAWLAAVERFPLERVALAGASIGANLALHALTKHPECPAALALSAGLNYRGLVPENDMRGLRSGQSVLLAASDEDAYAFDSTRELASIESDAAVETALFNGLGHGTTMFERDPKFMAWSADWIAGKITAR